MVLSGELIRSGKRKLNDSEEKFVRGNFQDNEMKCKIFAWFYFAICPDILSNDIRKFIQIKSIICDDLVHLLAHLIFVKV